MRLGTTDDVENVRKAFGEGADLVLSKPLSADRLRRILAAIDSLEWKTRSGARLPLFTDVLCSWGSHQILLRSLNISESGMLLRPSPDVELGQEVALEFKIAELHATLSVLARIVRKEDADRIAVRFVAPAPEDQNAIEVYVMGRLKELTPSRNLSVRLQGVQDLATESAASPMPQPVRGRSILHTLPCLGRCCRLLSLVHALRRRCPYPTDQTFRGCQFKSIHLYLPSLRGFAASNRHIFINSWLFISGASKS